MVGARRFVVRVARLAAVLRTDLLVVVRVAFLAAVALRAVLRGALAAVVDAGFRFLVVEVCSDII